MKKILLISLLLISIRVNASTCSNERAIELSGLANNVNALALSYERVSESHVNETFGTSDRNYTYEQPYERPDKNYDAAPYVRKLRGNAAYPPTLPCCGARYHIVAR